MLKWDYSMEMKYRTGEGGFRALEAGAGRGHRFPF